MMISKSKLGVITAVALASATLPVLAQALPRRPIGTTMRAG
jgi:hypothetical protein